MGERERNRSYISKLRTLEEIFIENAKCRRHYLAIFLMFKKRLISHLIHPENTFTYYNMREKNP